MYRHFGDASEAYAAGHHHNESVQRRKSLKTLVHPFTLAARAKLNLRLEVGPLRGRLHTLLSVIAELALADELTFAPSGNTFHVTCDLPGVAERDNLAWRAVHALGVPVPALSIAIAKRIPAQAGLGGGSADAAAALVGFDKVCKEQGLSLAPAQLARAALEVGSDVPSFLTRGLKIVSGIGDTVRSFECAPPSWGIVLLQPSCGSQTAQAYALLDADRVPHELGPAALAFAEQMCAAFRDADFERFTGLLHNDFTKSLERAMPAIASVRERLTQAGAQATLLCGSGSCVAGFFEHAAGAARAGERIELQTGEWVATTRFGGGS